jgi:hypothetical protein
MKRTAVFASTTLAILAIVPAADAAFVSPSSKDYGAVNVGAKSAATTFVLQTSANICTNYDPMLGICFTSTAYATDTTALGGGPGTTTTASDFAVHNISCAYPSEPSPVAFGPSGVPGFCQFEVSFAPSAPGGHFRAMDFADSGGPTAILNLTGLGVALPTSATPTTTTPAGKKKCKKKHKRAATAKKKCKKRKR